MGYYLFLIKNLVTKNDKIMNKEKKNYCTECGEKLEWKPANYDADTGEPSPCSFIAICKCNVTHRWRTKKCENYENPEVWCHDCKYYRCIKPSSNPGWVDSCTLGEDVSFFTSHCKYFVQKPKSFFGIF